MQIMKAKLSLLLIIIPLWVFSQDSLLLPDKLIKLVEKNILIARIVNHKFNNPVYNPTYVCNQLLPDTNQKLDITFELSGFDYPLTNYQTYIVKTNDFLFVDEPFTEKYVRKYPYEPDDSILLCRESLIAYNKQSKDVKFVSINFIPDYLIDDFKLEEFDLNRVEEYLFYRLYNYRLDKSIELITNNREKVVFIGNSAILRSKVKITYDKEHKEFSVERYTD